MLTRFPSLALPSPLALRLSRGLRFVCAFLLILGLIFPLPLALAQTSAPPSDAEEVSYIWQRGDSLSSVLYKLGIGHNKSGARIYGKRGWVARNIEFYARKDWDATPEGTAIKILKPKHSLPVAAALPKADAPLPKVDAPIPLEVREPSPLPVPEKDLEIESTILDPEPVPSEVEPSAPTDVRVHSSVESVKPLALGATPVLNSKQILAAIVLLALALFAIQSMRTRTLKERQRKVSVVANGLLSWLTFNGPQSAEHITMALTFFTGKVSAKSLNGYEVMGYLATDMIQLKRLEDQMRIDSYAPPFASPLPPLQSEYLDKFLGVSPEVFANLIGSASSPFLQIRALRLLTFYTSHTHNVELAPKLVETLVKTCSRYPSLIKNPAVRQQIGVTLESFDSSNPLRATA